MEVRQTRMWQKMQEIAVAVLNKALGTTFKCTL